MQKNYIERERIYALGENGVIHVQPVSRNQQLHIAVLIDTVLEVPPKTGVTHRLYTLCKGLTNHGVQITLIVCNRQITNEKDLDALRSFPCTRLYFVPPETYFSPRLLQRMLRATKVNILQVEDAVSLLRYRPLADVLQIPIVLEMHDVEMSLKEQLGYREKDLIYARVVDSLACIQADAVICMTPEDKTLIEGHLRAESRKVTMVPNPIDLSLYHHPHPDFGNQQLVFLGNMHYPPNQKAAMDIRKYIFPAISRQLPKLKFVMIGMCPKNIVDSATTQRFNFLGPTKRLSRELKHSSLALNPVKTGSGMKVKILDYCAAGLPVIASTIGAAGYQKIQSIIVEDVLRYYPKIIKRIMRNHLLWKELSKKNRAAVAKYYSLPNTVKKMINVYEQTRNEVVNIMRRRRGGKDIILPASLWLSEKRHQKIHTKKTFGIANYF